MKLKPRLIMLLTAFALSSTANAADDDTMMVVEEGATPEDIVRVIQLPDRASPAAGKSSAFGKDKSNDAKALGKEFGKQMAEEAKSRNAKEKVRDDMRYNARREARGSNGRGNRPDG